MRRNVWLLLAALGSFLVTELHLAIVVGGPPWFRYFGAPGLAVEIERGHVLGPVLLTIAVGILSAIWGAYALAGAGVIRRLPATRPALFAIGAVYALRGLLVVAGLLDVLRGGAHGWRWTAISACALAVGVCYLVGAARAGPGAGKRISRSAALARDARLC